MPRMRAVSNNFTSGQLDETMWERYDYQGYNAGLKHLDNYLILPQGGVTGRNGTRFVSGAKTEETARFIPFILTNTIAYVLEVGDLYIRFYANNHRITNPDTSITEVVTPYSSEQVRDIHWAISGDKMTFFHPLHAPHELVYRGETDWLFRVAVFAPPPTYEDGYQPGIPITLSATTGNGITATVGSNIFFESDVDRLIMEEPLIGTGRMVITAVNSLTQVTGDVIAPFTTTTLGPIEWRMGGSPVCVLHISDKKTGPVGARVTLTTQMVQPGNTELITDGDFPDLSNWTDKSGPFILVGGVADAGSDDETIVDSAGDFLAVGVRVGHRAIGTAGEDSVTAVNSPYLLFTTKKGALWALASTYDIRKTGVAYVVSAGYVSLDGGAQGIGWIEQSITTVAGVGYRLTFDVSDAPVSAMVGTASDTGDLLAEFSYPPANDNEVFFTATGTTTYIAFRNNQNQVARLSNVSIKGYDADGLRITDVGRFIRGNNGIIEITELLNNTMARGTIRKELDDALDMLSGAWSLESSQWSDALGWPRTGTYQGGRLVPADTNRFPLRFWGSRISVPDDFGLGPNPDDPYQYDLYATQGSPILWIAGERNLLAGTARNEFSIRGDLGASITSTSVDAQSPTALGSISIQPIRAPSAIFFVHRSGNRLYESILNLNLTQNVERDVQDRSVLAESLTASGIRAIAYQHGNRPIVWVVAANGTLRTLTYLREQVIAGWSQQSTQGIVLDVCVIPHPDGDRDQVWLMVDRGSTVPFIEFFEDNAGFYSHLTVDSAVVSSVDPASNVITGLDHLNGKEVVVLVDGVQQIPQVVASGSVTVETAGLLREVGLAFIPRLITLRPVVGNVPLNGLIVSNFHVSLTFQSTVNALVNGQRFDFAEATTPLNQPHPLYSGIKRLDTVGWDVDASLTIEQDLPYPITILSINRFVEIEEYASQSSPGL